MFFKTFILVCALGAVFAYPYADEEYYPESYDRVRRQAPPDQLPLQLSGGGGGSPKTGYDISLDGRAPVWNSNDGRKELGLSGGYSQHLGGPYGNSRPDFRAGADYTWKSQNGRHEVGVNGGYSKPGYGRESYNVGAGYTYRFRG